MARTVKAEQEDTQAKKAPAGASHNYYGTGPAGRGWLYGLLAALVVVLVFLAGVGVAGHRHGDLVFKTGGMMDGGFGFGHRGFDSGGFGSNVTVNGQSRVRGVVTSVNGSDFTIAGNGSTTNVTTNSSTQYQGGNQVKQNDSVIVWGTDSNGTITASQIAINP